MLNFNLNLRI